MEKELLQEDFRKMNYHNTELRKEEIKLEQAFREIARKNDGLIYGIIEKCDLRKYGIYY